MLWCWLILNLKHFLEVFVDACMYFDFISWFYVEIALIHLFSWTFCTYWLETFFFVLSQTFLKIYNFFFWIWMVCFLSWLRFWLDIWIFLRSNHDTLFSALLIVFVIQRMRFYKKEWCLDIHFTCLLTTLSFQFRVLWFQPCFLIAVLNVLLLMETVVQQRKLLYTISMKKKGRVHGMTTFVGQWLICFHWLLMGLEV